MEEWKQITEYPNYEISTLGRIRRPDGKYGGIERKQKQEHNGYITCCFSKDGKYHTKSVHRIVAEAFIPNPENKEQIDHIDRNKANNVVSNLRWATRSENQWNRGRTDNQYIRQVWKVQWTKEGKNTQREFSSEADARAFRLQELGF